MSKHWDWALNKAVETQPQAGSEKKVLELHERELAVACLHQMQAHRPLKPPGRR